MRNDAIRDAANEGSLAKTRWEDEWPRPRDLAVLKWSCEQYGARMDPSVSRLAGVAAVNEVRPHVQRQLPESEWISARRLRGEGPRHEAMPRTCRTAWR